MSAQNKEIDFEKIYQATYNKILRFIVIRCNNIDDVNDIIQDTYIELFKIIVMKRLLDKDNIENYIFGIANNIIKRYYHKKKKENILSFYTENENDSNLYIEDNFDLEQKIITKENVKEVWEYIKTKELITIKVFYLYFVLGLKISEISEELNINESNVKNKIYRTLREVKKYLGEEVRKDD